MLAVRLTGILSLSSEANPGGGPRHGTLAELEGLGVENLFPACEGSGWTAMTREEKLVCPACAGSGRNDRDWRQTGDASGGGAGGGI